MSTDIFSYVSPGKRIALGTTLKNPFQGEKIISG
jgi:hypothetical protein